MKRATSGDRMWGLRELPLPDPVPWTPETYGWVGVAMCAFGLACWIAFKRYRHWKSQAYRREALAELDAMNHDRAHLASLPHLLRRTALSAFPRAEVASLQGPEWIHWLNSAGAAFTTQDAAPLDRLAYQPQLAEELDDPSVDRLLSASRSFVRTHRARV